MNDDTSKSLTQRPRPGYDIGYGKPPIQTRFKSGSSGNPKGRPRGAKNKPEAPSLAAERLKEIVLEEAYRLVTVNDPAGPIQVPMAQAVMRSISVNAAKGLQRAQRLFTELVSTTERDRRRLHDQFLEAAINYKVEWERELYRRQKLGVTGPEPLPHPDHVVVDLSTGTVRIIGPATKEDKEQWDHWLSHKALFEQELADLRVQLAEPDCPNRRAIRREIEKTETVLEILRRVGQRWS